MHAYAHEHTHKNSYKVNTELAFFLLELQEVKKLLSAELGVRWSCNNCTEWEWTEQYALKNK